MEHERMASKSGQSYHLEGDMNELHTFTVAGKQGKQPLDTHRLRETILWASAGYSDVIDASLIIEETLRNVFDGMSKQEVADALVLATVAFIERDPGYGYVAARLLFKKLYKLVTKRTVLHSDVDHEYSRAFVRAIQAGVEQGLFDKRMLDFNLEHLALAIVPERDHLIDYMGLRTLYERYFLKIEDEHVELPQIFWMRVAMGVALNEPDREDKAIEFYNSMSLLRYVPSTPTLLHSGLKRAQLSSCFLSTTGDDLKDIFKAYSDTAQLLKWSGGVANDWTNIRATGAIIKSIRIESQGLIPFLKISNDTTAAINRSGRRRAASVVYVENWHYDYEDFLDLRRNTGDERRRAHDINTASWIPDLFMKRVEQDGDWTLFSPEEVPDLHDIYGKKFEDAYVAYEQKAKEGKIELFKTIPAKQLWRKMLSRLFETGHPWITFKDACNVRSPQDHAGVVHSSNLCTEITLNTSADEVAVCNLGSVNLGRHVVNGKIDDVLLAHTVSSAVRMLDNVVDINFYPIDETRNSNMRHRPIGLGIMGFQDALYTMGINFSDEKARAFADESTEKIAYHAILSSSKLAQERGTYQSYKGSKWDRGILPQDTIDLLEKERGLPVKVKRGGVLDWTPVREHIKKHGMRNSNTMAIAPTATISTISGCFPCIEPIYKNIYVKSNMSGEFTVVNKYLIEDLKARGLWSKEMLDELKFNDGSLDKIAAMPQDLKDKHQEAFAIDPLWLIEITAARGKWIDQSQSHNVFMSNVSGKMLNDVYFAGWHAGLKTFYYFRTLGASQVEKSTLDAKKFGFTQKRAGAETAAGQQAVETAPELVATSTANVVQEAAPQEGLEDAAACSLSTDPDCEVCQ